MATVWIVVEVPKWTWRGRAKDPGLLGIFTTEAAAKAVCTVPGDSMWPVELDQFLGREHTLAPITYQVAGGRRCLTA